MKLLLHSLLGFFFNFLFLRDHTPFLQNVEVEGLRWRLVDAKGVVLGRLASQISKLLQGKDKPVYDPSKDLGDVVVVINAKDVELTGRKFENKVYRWHTGYPGGLKERTVKDQWERDPTQILRRAVSGMLPKNNLRKVSKGGNGNPNNIVIDDTSFDR